MESKDYEQILNAMPETAVYVIREDNHHILYYNRRVHMVSPQVRIGMTCHEVWTGSCVNCPLLTITNRQEGRSICYNPTFGGVVDMVATRILWEGDTPAFVVSVTPRLENAGYTYRKILRVDLDRDCYEVLKIEPDSLLDGKNTENFSLQLELFAESGAIHPDDAERFISFIRPERLKRVLQSDKRKVTCIYRRRWMGDFRWKLMEVVKCFDYSEDNRMVIFCVLDIHDAMHEGLERQEIVAHNQDILRTVGEQCFRIYDVDLGHGTVVPVLVDGSFQSGSSSPLPNWDDLVHSQIHPLLHTAYQRAFEHKFSLEGLRQANSTGVRKNDLLCQWQAGKTYRYISVTAYCERKENGNFHGIVAFQDVDERVRRELVHSQWDMQMADIFKSRYTKMDTVHLDSGQCERISLDDENDQPSPLVGIYEYHMQQALYNHVHPDDAVKYYTLMSLDHLREKAAETESYSEEICQYRLKGEPVHWVEQHIIYSRKEDGVRVSLLGQDITAEKRQEEKKLREQQERNYIISCMNSLFFSTYYVDLAHNTFRAVTQLNSMGDPLGSEVNCTAALRIYAENFIHPEDREEYLRVMNIENWYQTLRQWNRNVTFTYRQLPAAPDTGSEDCRWVLATAILGQCGEDDMPKTVVYVAQDITESRAKIIENKGT